MTESQVEQINSALEKSELMAAIGREIQRAEQEQSVRGYTSWAVKAAIGLLAWELLNFAQPYDWSGVARTFLVLLYIFIAVRATATLVRGSGRVASSSSRLLDVGVSTPARRGSYAYLLACMIGLTALALFVGSTLNGAMRFVPAFLFLIFTLGSLVVLALPWLPFGDETFDSAKKKRYSMWVPRILIGLCIAVSLFVLYDKSVALEQQFRSNELKVAGVLLVLLFLCSFEVFRSEGEEKSARMRRLELELALGRVPLESARERFEMLMLGITSKHVVRPWVQEVAGHLDDVRALLLDAENLLGAVDRELDALSAKQGSDKAVVALIDKADEAIRAARAQHARAVKSRSRLFFKIVIAKNASGLKLEEVAHDVMSIDGAVSELDAALNRIQERLPVLTSKAEAMAVSSGH